MNQHPLNGATVVITGASSGIGRATALTFARRGANLVLAARRAHVLADVAAECERWGAQALAVPTDVTDPQAMKQLAQEAAATFGGIDVWVNNAGIGAVGEFTQTPLAAHEQVVRTNLLGYLNGAHAVLPYFQRQQAGVLINVISVGGWVPQPYAVAYSASKFGLRGYSEALRAELRHWPAIHVCDVFPAFIDTPGFQHGGNYTGREVKPAPPVYDPQQVAEAIVALVRRPHKEVTVGASATVLRLSYALLPGVTRWALARFVESYFRQARPVPVTDGSMFEPKPAPRGTGISGGWRSSDSRNRGAWVGAALVAGAAAGLYMTLSSSEPSKRG